MRLKTCLVEHFKAKSTQVACLDWLKSGGLAHDEVIKISSLARCTSLKREELSDLVDELGKIRPRL
jgi:hypothetical protein